MPRSTPGRRRIGAAVATLATLCLVASLLTSRGPSESDAAQLAVQARGGLPVPADGPGFSIGTFNILGSQHTRGGSDPYGSGKKRAALVAKLIQRKAVDVIGLQEVQSDQLEVLENSLQGYDVWPGTRLGGGGVRLQVAWNTSVFAARGAGWIDAPFDRLVRPVPWVLLEHRASGRQTYVIDTHNSPRGLEQERDQATEQQVALINQLRASRQSVFFLGDMNEKREIFCTVVSKTSLRAANGGAATSKRDCTLPTGPLHIDWIFGAGPMLFSGYQSFQGGQVRTASDHDLIRAQVTLRPRNS